MLGNRTNRFIDVQADTVSLVVPLIAEQPFSVSAVGVGADGRTTWQVAPGSQTGTVPAGGIPTGEFFHLVFPNSLNSRHSLATLIEGPNDAVFYYDVPKFTFQASYSCKFGENGMDDCVAIIGQGTETDTATFSESHVPIRVQGGGGSTTTPVGSNTAAPSNTPGSSSSPSDSSSGTSLSPSAKSDAQRAGAGFSAGFIVSLVGFALF